MLLTLYSLALTQLLMAMAVGLTTLQALIRLSGNPKGCKLLHLAP
jgi:hypothetical protein